MSNDPKKNPGTYVLKKGSGEPSVDKQLAAWVRDWEHHIMHVLTSYMTAEGRVNQPFLRGVLWTIDDLESFQRRGWQVNLPANLRSTGANANLLPKSAPETGDDAAVRLHYQRLREADLALLREVLSKLNKVADANEPPWVLFGQKLHKLLFFVEADELRLYRTPQELLMECGKQMSAWLRSKGQAFTESVDAQWKQVFRHLTDIVLADRPRICDALKRREEEIDSYEKLMKFFQDSANEIEKVLEPMAMWEQILSQDGLGKRAVDELSGNSEVPEGNPPNTRRKVLQHKTTVEDSVKNDSVKKSNTKVPCSYLLQYGKCNKATCPFEHDESAMPESKRQQLVVPAGRSTPGSGKEKEKGDDGNKKHKFKLGGCTHCWMPKENPNFKTSHGNGDKYVKDTCPYSTESRGCKGEER
jgi:hypothetical protein